MAKLNIVAGDLVFDRSQCKSLFESDKVAKLFFVEKVGRTSNGGVVVKGSDDAPHFSASCVLLSLGVTANRREEVLFIRDYFSEAYEIYGSEAVELATVRGLLALMAYQLKKSLPDKALCLDAYSTIKESSVKGKAWKLLDSSEKQAIGSFVKNIEK